MSGENGYILVRLFQFALIGLILLHVRRLEKKYQREKRREEHEAWAKELDKLSGIKRETKP